MNAIYDIKALKSKEKEEKVSLQGENMQKSGMGSHQSHDMGKDEWLTPPKIVKSLGEFDLDPCSPINRPWDTAKKHYDITHNGLAQKWEGRVWCNPPYGKETGKWLSACDRSGNAIALIFARTETKMFFKNVWRAADAVFFFEGRLFFHHVDGTVAKANAGAPSCLVAYGANNVEAIDKSGLPGILVRLSKPKKNDQPTLF